MFHFSLNNFDLYITDIVVHLNNNGQVGKSLTNIFSLFPSYQVPTLCKLSLKEGSSGHLS